MGFLKRKSGDLSELKKQLTELAERVATENFDVKLDYSVDSVKQVEAILGQLHEDFKASNDDGGLRGLALEFAAYFISVIERNYSRGTWRRDDPAVGPETFPYEWNGVTLFPYGWCLKRLQDGAGDDVWAKFQALVVQRGAAG